MSSLPSIKVLVGVIATAMLMTACATQNANTSTNASTGYYGVPAMYRTIPERISDEAIERTSYKNLTNIRDVSENNVRIAIDSFRREVLLTGEVPSQQVKADVANMVASINDVKQVYDNLTVTNTPKAQSHTLHENYLKSKIIAKIVSAGGIRSSQYKLVVRDNMAYVVGFLTAQQEQTIVNIISSVQDIEGVRMLGTRIDGDTSALLALTGENVAIDDNPNAGGMVYGGNAVVNTPASPVYPNVPTNSVSTTSYPQSMYPNTQIAPTVPTQPNTGYAPVNNYPINTPVNNYPANNYPVNNHGTQNRDIPVIRMEGNPTSSYVNLYNNTSKP
ncbi:BON domain-containing protein [Moraxella bovis]|uniref:BON domain-containing protein n=1 Tax=Moraxella bovis TaxID=476 RepID=A0AAQ2Q563_MORBO|nr:BON domain-containing protein [Moraxella bovis]AWY21151.1 BON domain-containing protein [Moraxella bovis]OOR89977.1 hypothetical protein B0182_06160 [Moraxella bovis]UYZ75412.1 BON domain-containing protein [Moraxella bovis]UYZ78655.1 BON domain-containing protein [Moraxella bovis]UYZ81622.1 BON domain-containing protein [Moraxella bovis]